MSSKNLPRIKEIRQKNNGNYSSVPLGSEGQYVDMLSGLDLEEELKLGGNHHVIVEEFENRTVVREKYFHESLNNIEDIEEEENTLDYLILTTIFNEGNFSFFIVDEQNNFIAIDSSLDSDFLGSGDFAYQQESINSIIIYPSGLHGYCHLKNISINETENKEANSIVTTIAEEVNNI